MNELRISLLVLILTSFIIRFQAHFAKRRRWTPWSS